MCYTWMNSHITWFLLTKWTNLCWLWPIHHLTMMTNTHCLFLPQLLLHVAPPLLHTPFILQPHHSRVCVHVCVSVCVTDCLFAFLWNTIVPVPLNQCVYVRVCVCQHPGAFSPILHVVVLITCTLIHVTPVRHRHYCHLIKHRLYYTVNTVCRKQHPFK